MNGIDIISDTTGQKIVKELEKIARTIGYEGKAALIEYGVRWITSASSPLLERVKRVDGEMSLWDISFEANVGGNITENPFDKIELFNPKEWTDPDGNKFRRFKRFYLCKETVGEYSYIWVCAEQISEAYRLPRAFYRNGQPYWNYVDIGAYEGSTEVINGVNYLASKSGKIVAHNITRTEAFNQAKAWGQKRGIIDEGEQYLITTISEITEILQPLLMIMFGTKNSQAIYNGVNDIWTDDCYVGYGENNTNRALIDIQYEREDKLKTFKKGACIVVDGRTDWRLVTEVELVTIGSTEYLSVQFDGSPVNLWEGDDSEDGSCIYRWSAPTGESDLINATHGTLENDGWHSFKVMGIENIYGNIFKHILDCTVQSRKVYICEQLDKWTDTKTPASDSAFTMCDITLSTSGWITELTADEIHPDVVLPTKVMGGSDKIYYADYVYSSNTATPYTVCFGGCCNYYSSVGLFFWSLNYSVGSRHNGVGARLSHRAL